MFFSQVSFIRQMFCCYSKPHPEIIPLRFVPGRSLAEQTHPHAGTQMERAALASVHEAARGSSLRQHLLCLLQPKGHSGKGQALAPWRRY